MGTYERVAARFGMSLYEYVTRKSSAVAGVTSLVIGVSRLEQVTKLMVFTLQLVGCMLTIMGCICSWSRLLPRWEASR